MTHPDAERPESFRDEVDGVNRQRVRWVVPAMIVAHLVHVWAFWVPASEQAALGADMVRFRAMVVGIHAATAVVDVAFAGLVWFGPRRWMRVLAPSIVLVYLLHGAAIAAADQLNIPTVTPFLAYSIVCALVVVMHPTTAAGVWAVGVVAYLGALFGFQDDPELRRPFLLNGPTVTIASVAITWLFYSARKRDFEQRRIIATQQSELEALNTALERRVADQVEEILQRSKQIEALNLQLRTQVRDRSRALAVALERLADADIQTRPLEGRLLDGRFEVLRRIGVGGMGAVYEGVDRHTRERVAIKTVRGDLGSTGLLKRFLREAEAVATLRHPAIVRMLHVDIDEDGTLYQVQELIQGEPLSQVLDRHGRFAPPVATRLLAELAGALAAAHERGVVHRDIKPGNIMCTRTAPGLKLLDFGIAKLREAVQVAQIEQNAETGEFFRSLPPRFGEETTDGEGSPLSTEPLTRTGVVVGTPGYMAPEQLAGAGTGVAADIYALGVVGWVVLSGQRPVSQEDGVTPPGLHGLGAPAPLLSVLSDCLASKPSERPSARRLAESLTTLADSLGSRPLHQSVELDAVRQSTGGDSEPTAYPTLD